MCCANFGVPVVPWDKLGDLFSIALALALIAFMEAISVAQAIEEKDKTDELRPNQELIALGLSNVIGSFFQSYPTTGGFSRTAVNQEIGARSGLSLIISALVIALTLLFLTDLFYQLPNAILAAIIMVAVSGLIDLRYPKILYKKRKDEQRRLKELKRLRKKARRDRRKKRNSKSSDQDTEKTESVDQKEKAANASETKNSNSIKIELNASMISTFQLKEHIGLREYLAIPNNGLNKKDALSFAVSLLQKDVQESIRRNLLKKLKGGDLRLANARRSIRMDNDPVVWIPKEFLKPKTGNITRKCKK